MRLEREPLVENVLNRKQRMASATIVRPNRKGSGFKGTGVQHKFPIPDKAHARAAMARINQSDLTPAEKAKVMAVARAKLAEGIITSFPNPKGPGHGRGNPYHRPDDGKFTFKPSGPGTGKLKKVARAAGKAAPKKSWAPGNDGEPGTLKKSASERRPPLLSNEALAARRARKKSGWTPEPGSEWDDRIKAQERAIAREREDARAADERWRAARKSASEREDARRTRRQRRRRLAEGTLQEVRKHGGGNPRHYPKGAPASKGGEFAPKPGGGDAARLLGKLAKNAPLDGPGSPDVVAVARPDGNHVFGSVSGRFRNGDVELKLEDGRRIRVKRAEITHRAAPRGKGKVKRQTKKLIADQAKQAAKAKPKPKAPKKPEAGRRRASLRTVAVQKPRGARNEPDIADKLRARLEAKRKAGVAQPGVVRVPEPKSRRGRGAVDAELAKRRAAEVPPDPYGQPQPSKQHIQAMPEHRSADPLTKEQRTYEGYGASLTRPAPAHVRDIGAWERAAEQVQSKTGKKYDDWGPKEFAAATAIYKHTIRKAAEGGYGPGGAKPRRAFAAAVTGKPKAEPIPNAPAGGATADPIPNGPGSPPNRAEPLAALSPVASSYERRALELADMERASALDSDREQYDRRYRTSAGRRRAVQDADSYLDDLTGYALEPDDDGWSHRMEDDLGHFNELLRGLAIAGKPISASEFSRMKDSFLKAGLRKLRTAARRQGYDKQEPVMFLLDELLAPAPRVKGPTW